MSTPEQSTALDVIKANSLSFQQVRDWGDVFFKAGLFEDIKNASAAMVKIQAGNELGIPAFASMNGIHLIKGKATLGAKLQATLVNTSPNHRYEVRELTDTACELEFFGKGVIDGKWRSIGTSRFTMEDAQKAGLTNAANYKGGDRDPGKGQNHHMYQKWSRNMLFARAMTQGVAWYCPEVLKGSSGNVDVFDDADDAIKASAATPEPIDRQPEQRSTAAEPAAAPASGDTTDHSNTIDAEVETPSADPQSAEESQKADLKTAIGNLLVELAGDDLDKLNELLKGRQLDQMTLPNLESFYKQLWEKKVKG